MSEQLKMVAKEMADLTKPKCASCRAPHACCGDVYCEATIDYAKTYWGEELKRTEHERLPLMGPKGCVAPPHLRPICAVHVCEQHLMRDAAFHDQYFRLRERFNDLLAEHDFGD